MIAIISRQAIVDKAHSAFAAGKYANPFPASSAAAKTWDEELAELVVLRNAMTHQQPQGVAQ